jgi:hypothetical protein
MTIASIIKKVESMLKKLKEHGDDTNYNKLLSILKELIIENEKIKSKSQSPKNSKAKTPKKSAKKSSKAKTPKKSAKKTPKSESKSPKKKCSENMKEDKITLKYNEISNRGGKKNIVTMFNGGLFYYVHVSPKSINVFEFTGSELDDTDLETKNDDFEVYFDKHVLCTDYKKLFIGDDKKNKHYGYGNSVLIHVRDDEYIFICNKIVQFKTDKKITKFFSPIGNSSVPYPYAEDEDSRILLLVDENKGKVSIPVLQHYFNDPWGDYYGHTKTKVKPVKRLIGKVLKKIKYKKSKKSKK